MKLVHDGRLEEKSIDRAVKRVLRLKFRLGLFENPYADENYAMKNNRSAENLLLSLNMARESVVLLKNKQGILPLNLDKYKDIAVIGPNAAHAHYGGYTTEWSYDKGISILDGLQRYSQNSIRYVPLSMPRVVRFILMMAIGAILSQHFTMKTRTMS